jgi:hypothetical protein
MFFIVTWHADVADVPDTHVTLTADTSADAEFEPKRPKENPAMATPETRVIAIRMTVARTGESARLRPNLPRYNFGRGFASFFSYNRYGRVILITAP